MGATVRSAEPGDKGRFAELPVGCAERSISHDERVSGRLSAPHRNGAHRAQMARMD
jgi:hypothetical protein